MHGPAAHSQRILVAAPNWIGDAMMALPLLEQLKRSVPGREIAALAPPAVAEVLTASEPIDEVITHDWSHGKLQLAGRWAMARTLRARRFDLAVILPNSLKSALLPWLAAVPVRIGYIGEARRGLLTHWLPAPLASTPMRERYMALARLVDADRAMPEPVPLPSLHANSALAEAVAQRFQLELTQPYAVFCPGAEYGAAKRWPAAHFASLAALLRQRQPELQIVLAGAKGDRAVGAQIQALSPIRLVSTIGATSVSEVMALLSRAGLVVSNDSGLMHLAAALGRPLVALYGSTDPRHTPPQAADAKIFWLQLSCSPCFARVCPLGHLHCLTQLSAEHVFASIDAVTVH